jgi:hypothetical protein
MTLESFFEQRPWRAGEPASLMGGVGLLGSDLTSQRQSPFRKPSERAQIGEFAEAVGVRAAILGFAAKRLELRDQTRLFDGGGPRLADAPVRAYLRPPVIDRERSAGTVEVIALLQQWLEGENHDSTEAREWDEFKVSLDLDRSSPRKLFR